MEQSIPPDCIKYTMSLPVLGNEYQKKDQILIDFNGHSVGAQNEPTVEVKYEQKINPGTATEKWVKVEYKLKVSKLNECLDFGIVHCPAKVGVINKSAPMPKKDAFTTNYLPNLLVFAVVDGRLFHPARMTKEYEGYRDVIKFDSMYINYKYYINTI